MSNPAERTDLYGRTRRALLLCAAAGVGVVIWLFLIPSDPKNSVLLGLSASRWGMILAAAAITLGLLLMTRKPKLVSGWIEKVNAKPVSTRIAVIVMLGVLLWLVLLFPAQYLGDFKYNADRLRPLIALVLAIPLILVTAGMPGNRQLSAKQAARGWLIGAGIVTSLAGVVFALLRGSKMQLAEGSILQPAGTIVTAPQFGLLIAAIVLLVVFVRSLPKPWLIVGTLAAISASAWFVTPLPCSNDRLPAMPPNDVCYPQITDAVYSIGSHYIVQGQGVYNHWMTDKPFYMGFLALGQWIFGAEIDHYLILQVLLMAFLPGLLYLLGRKLIGDKWAVLPAGLLILSQFNAIFRYNLLDGINVWFENTELLTAMLLLSCCLLLFKWTQDGGVGRLLLGGGLLGAAALTRFNAVTLIPFLVLYVFAASKEKGFGSRIKAPAIVTIGLLIVMLPWLFNAVDANGNNFYWMKIQDVIQQRYGNRGDTANSNVLLKPVSAVKLESQPSPVTAIGLHFANNHFTAFTELPTRFRLLNSVDTAYSPLFYEGRDVVIWDRQVSAENIVVIGLMIFLFAAGVFFSIRKAAWAGALPLIFQAVYLLGNSFSQTSGGRYLTPVSWVTFLYAGIGVAAILTPLLSKWGVESEAHGAPAATPASGLNWKIGLLVCVVLGAFLPILNHLPEKPAETPIKSPAWAALETTAAAQDPGWQKVLEDPNVVIDEGYAYHPSYTRFNQLYPGVESLQLLILGRDVAYEAVLKDVNAPGRFSADSQVLFVGCKVQDVNYWGAPFIRLKLLALVQQDHEGYQLVGNAPLRCDQ